jgi:hypothetical protein
MNASSDLPEPLDPRTMQSASSAPSRARLRAGLVITLIGMFILMVGAKPGWFGWSRSSGVGFVKISVFLLGLGVICAGGLLGLLSLWRAAQRTIVSDIGMRLVATGYVISIFSGLADVFGFGSQPLPETPFFGPVQAAGVMVGQAVIAIGFLMLIPYGSSLQRE